MRWSKVRKREVVDTSTARRIGRLTGAVLDATSRRMTALVVSGARKGMIVDWEVASVGPDAVTIPGASSLRRPRDEREQRADGSLGLLGKQVLDDRGDRLGKVRDIVFDAGSGELLELVLDKDRQVEADRLLGAGSFAVVVRSAA